MFLFLTMAKIVGVGLVFLNHLYSYSAMGLGSDAKFFNCVSALREANEETNATTLLQPLCHKLPTILNMYNVPTNKDKLITKRIRNE